MPTKKKTNKVKSSKVIYDNSFKERVEPVDEGMPEKKPAPAVVEVEPAKQPAEVANAIPKTKLYVAHSNLSNNGERIADAGDEIALSEKLAAHYSKVNPGCIVEVV